VKKAGAMLIFIFCHALMVFRTHEHSAADPSQFSQISSGLKYP